MPRKLKGALLTAVTLTGERMSPDFSILTGAGKVEGLRARRRGRGRRDQEFTICVDHDYTPTHVLTVGSLMSPVIADANLPLDAVIEHAEAMARIELGIPLVITEQGRPVGVLSYSTLDDYKRNEYLLAGLTRGSSSLASYKDQDLAGRIKVTPPLGITCATCGTLNKVVFFVEGATPCVNKSKGEHLLVRRRR